MVMIQGRRDSFPCRRTLPNYASVLLRGRAGIERRNEDVEFLFLGGPFHGERFLLSGKMERVKVPRFSAQRRGVPEWTEEEYLKRGVHTKAGMLPFYVHRGFANDQPTVWVELLFQVNSRPRQSTPRHLPRKPATSAVRAPVRILPVSPYPSFTEPLTRAYLAEED